MSSFHNEKVIYGIYDNRGAPLWVRLNDFFIDRAKVSLKEKAYFYELFSVMIDAGIPILKALQILADKTTNERFQRVIQTIIYSIEHGDKLSIALAKFPTVFPETEIGIIQSGELSGSLNVVLSRLSDDINKTLDLQMKIRQAMMYPITILITLALALIIILGVVIPPLKNLFESIRAEVPGSLVFLMQANLFIQNNFLLLFIIVVAGVFFFLSYIKSEQGKIWWDKTKLSFPIVKGLLQKILLIRFARNLGMLLDSGLSLVKTLKTTSIAVGNEIYRLTLEQVVLDIQKGERLSASLERYPQLFPEDLTQIIAVGEKSASISSSTQKVTHQYEREIDHALKNLTGVIEPIAIIGVGIVVGWFAFVVLGSIFSISENIG